jgi:hypothetical protein
MLQLDIPQGSQFDRVLTGIAPGGGSPTGFLDSDALSSVVWTGQNQAPLFSPTVSWHDSGSCKFNFGLTPASTATLDYSGIYHCQVTATRGTTPVQVADFLLKMLPSPGTGAQILTPYCSLADMLNHAPWLTMVQDDLTDQESFYTQRLEAKQWLDWLIVRAWRGTSDASFGDPGRGARFWQGGWTRRSPMPSKWLIDQLSGGVVIPPLVLTSGGGGYTWARVEFSGGGPLAVQAQGTAIVSGGQVISLQLISAGNSYSSTPIMTIVGDGTGATGFCKISGNVLMLRPNIVRICALKAASIVGMGQIGRQNNIAVFGAMWRDMASSEASTIVAELDLNGDGFADMSIPLVATNTLFG